MKVFLILPFVTLLIVGIYIKTHKDYFMNNATCEIYDEFMAKEISGVITDKYRDKNHHLNERIIIGMDIIDIGLDKSDFYNFVTK